MMMIIILIHVKLILFYLIGFKVDENELNKFLNFIKNFNN